MWNSIVKVRQHERDVAVQQLAITKRQLQQLIETRDQYQLAHAVAVADARASERLESLDVRSLAAHRAHVKHCFEAVERIEVEIAAAEMARERLHVMVVAAWQRYEAVVRVQTQRNNARVQQRTRAAQLELEEVASAGRAMEAGEMSVNGDHRFPSM